MYEPLKYEYNMTPDSKLMRGLKWTFMLVLLTIFLSPLTAYGFNADTSNQTLFLFFIVLSLLCDFLLLTLTYSLNQYIIEDIEKEMEIGQTS